MSDRRVLVDFQIESGSGLQFGQIQLTDLKLANGLRRAIVLPSSDVEGTRE